MPRKPVEINPECGRRLKELLIAPNGMTQRCLAEKISCEPQHISNIIRGKRRLTPEIAQRIIDVAFPSIRINWLMCWDNFKTEADKAENSKRMWEEGRKLDEFHDRIFKCFIDSIEDLSGYGIHSQGSDTLLGDFIRVSDKNGVEVGAISVEAFNELQRELERYASYLVSLLVKDEMFPLPISEGGVKKWLTFKSAETKTEN